MLLLLCVWEWRSVAVRLSSRSVKSRVDEINGERRRLEKLVIIMRKVFVARLLRSSLCFNATPCTTSSSSSSSSSSFLSLS
jgi:hypothetical protein